jgi:RND family efflux transporter MFP subunit
MTAVRVPARLALALLAIAASCRRADPPAPPPLPVSVGEVRQATIPVYLEHVGTTEAVSTVEVRARVSGVLEKVLFKEGADVQQGDLLFVIEQKPYQTRVAQAKAQLEQKRAAELRTSADFERTEALAKKDVASKADLDHARAARDEAAAEVQAAQAALEQADLDLGYTEIRAPIGGRVGKLLKDKGNLVGSGEQTALATIVQLDPIYIYWSPSERTRLEVMRLRKEGVYGPRDDIEVHALLADGSEHPYLGKIDFVDNNIDPSAGTVRVRAVFPNPDKQLLPGQYANLRVLVGRDVPALLVPARAVIEEQGGSSVFVVTPDGVAQPRAVVASGNYGQDRVIEKGLEAGEKVAVDNLGKLRAGMKVEIKLAEAAPAPQSPASAQAP